MKLITQSEYKVMPWKNGRGVTAEIAKYPEESVFPDGDFLWRLSSAKVSSSDPFSSFPGCDRWLAVWQGEGLSLNEFKLLPGQPYHFHGEETISAKLIQGPVGDVGLIYRRDKVSAQMQTVSLHRNQSVRISSRDAHFIFCAKGVLQLGSIVAALGDTLQLDANSDCMLSAQENAVFFSISIRIL